MSHVFADATTAQQWPRLWRMVLVGLCTLILCSCRGPGRTVYDTSAADRQTYSALPPEAYTGPGESAMADGQTWTPPGIARPWPADEYLRDGGDRALPARVGPQQELRGLELEDTIAHYDTLDGKTVVEPSNRVHIYSPRFGAVRQVVSLAANEQNRRVAGVYLPTALAGPTTVQIVSSSKQNVQPDRRIAARPAVIYRSKQGDGTMSSATGPRAFQDAFLPYENLRLIRDGVVDMAEMARLARGNTAAIAWTHEQSVEVILDHRAAMAHAGDEGLQTLYTVKEAPARPQLRLVKVASTEVAEPGDEVAFTLRFDNVGNQAIGNVTIIDNLTTRLEYVADSAQCSVDAQFFTQPNEGDSLVLRCEVTDPVEPGEGGIIRFRCRVR